MRRNRHERRETQHEICAARRRPICIPQPVPRLGALRHKAPHEIEAQVPRGRVIQQRHAVHRRRRRGRRLHVALIISTSITSSPV